MTPDSYLDGRVRCYRGFYPNETAEALFERLRHEIEWLERGYHNHDGSWASLPRLTANYGERSYDYSGLQFQPKPWTPLLAPLKHDAEQLAACSFNALVLQYYRDGRDCIHWHSDDEPCVGQNPPIASISLGGSRDFWLKSRTPADPQRPEILKLRLHAGDLLLMLGDLQHTYRHKVPRENNAQPRINLTFRWVVG